MTSGIGLLLNVVISLVLYASFLWVSLIAYRRFQWKGFIPLIMGQTILLAFFVVSIMVRSYGPNPSRAMAIIGTLHAVGCFLVAIGFISVALKLKHECSAVIPKSSMNLRKPTNTIIATILLVGGFPVSLVIAMFMARGQYSMPFLGAVMIFAFVVVPLGAVVAIISLCRREKWLPLAILNMVAYILMIALTVKEIIK